MTEEQFVAWANEDVRAEWVDGEVIVMPPVSEDHAEVGWWLLSLVKLFVESRDLGRVLGSEYMVRFGKLRRRRVPDILFVAKSRTHLIGRDHLEGAPDLIIEIVSPDSESRDWRDKYEEYRRAGVREYWIVDPMSEHVEAYSLTRGGNSYRPIEEVDGVIRSKLLRGFFVRTKWLWKATRPSVLVALRELGVK